MKEKKSENRPQIYGKNGSLQPGWVNIQVPAEIAESLREIMGHNEVYLPDLAMILSKDVFKSITSLFDDNPLPYKNFIDLMFKFLDMESFTCSGNYEQRIHVLFHDIYYVLAAGKEYLENQKLKGGSYE